MGLLVRYVPGHVMARGQGYLAACSGIVSTSVSVLSGAIYAQYGQSVYYALAAMAMTGAVLLWLARHQLARPPQSSPSAVDSTETSYRHPPEPAHTRPRSAATSPQQ